MFILTVAARGGTEGTGRGEQVLLSSPGAFSTPLKVIFRGFSWPGKDFRAPRIPGGEEMGLELLSAPNFRDAGGTCRSSGCRGKLLLLP